ncbi:hypothetical protein [Chitinophaga caeni]|nr:hypothetical protein [Chitinophaga caeni]
MRNITQYVYDHRWQKPGDVALISKLTTLSNPNNGNFGISTGAYKMINIFEINTLRMGYQLPANFVKKIKMTTVGFNFSVTNLLKITGEKDRDPEIPYTSLAGLPTARDFMFGINCSF